MSKKGLVVVGIVALVTLVILLQTTTPATIHPLGILLVFALFYVVALSVFTYTLAGAVSVLRRWLPEAQRRRITLDFKHCYYFGSVLALAPVLLIGARSVGRGSWHEVLLIVLFELVACFYVAKR